MQVPCRDSLTRGIPRDPPGQLARPLFNRWSELGGFSSIAHRLMCPAERRAIDMGELLVCQPLCQHLRFTLPDLGKAISRIVGIPMADDIETHDCRLPRFRE